MAKKRSAVNNGKSTGGRTAQGQFAKGNPGRPEGTPNKVSAALKDDILQAYDERGGVEWLRGLSDREFIRLLQKVMPRQIAADVKMRAEDEPRIDYANMSEAELWAHARITGSIKREVEGEVWSYEDADAALGLREVKSLVDGLDGGDGLGDFDSRHVGPLAAECLEYTIAALRKHLPELTALLPKAEAKLAELRAGEAQGVGRPRALPDRT